MTFKTLKTAVDIIDRYTKERGCHFKVKNTLKIIASKLSDNVKKEIELWNGEVQKAIETIKSHIEKYEEGTVEERSLADLARKAIENYNHSLKPKSLRGRLENFLFPLAYKKVRLSKKSNAVQSFSPSPLKPEINDLFGSKVLSLITQKKLPISVSKYLNEFKKAPLTCQTQADITSLEQTFTPFPGEVYIIRGSFKKTANRDTPLKFDFISQVNQTGFPHCSQYHGLALTEELLPNDEKIDEKRREIAKKLHPDGSLNERAKKLLEKKAKIFDDNLQKYLALHKKLAQAIANAAGYDEFPFPSFDSYHSLSNYYHEQIENDLCSVLGKACRSIISKREGSDIELSSFEKKVQIFTLKQFYAFIDELETNSFDLEKLLESDIELFQSNIQ